MAMNLSPSALQEQKVQEQKVQEQKVQEKQTWKDWANGMIAYCHLAKANDQYAWKEEDEKKEGHPRCCFYENNNKNMDPNFQIFFRNLKEKEAIQEKIDSVIIQHDIPEHGPGLYHCKNGNEYFSIFINEKRKKANYVYKMYLIESITGYTIDRGQKYKKEDIKMDEHAESVDFI